MSSSSRAYLDTYDRPVPALVVGASTAFATVFDRSTPTITAVFNANADVYTRPIPIPPQSLVSSIASTYDRPVPVATSWRGAAAYSYETDTTANPTQLKRWDGTQWVRSPYYIWNGTAWVQVT